MESYREEIEITDKEFCEIHTNIYGELIDNPKQISMIRFNGEELKEYTESVLNSYISERIKIEYAIECLNSIYAEIDTQKSRQVVINKIRELKNKRDGK